MGIKIIEEKQNPLFNRKEVILEVQSNVTPSHLEAEKIISDKFSTKPEAFKIKKIKGSFGSKDFKIIANIYPSKKEKEEIEFKSKKERELELKAIEEAKKAEEEKKKAEVETKISEEEKKNEEKTEEKSEIPEEDKDEVAKEEKKTEKEVKETQAEAEGK